jgi:hypothetical protein
VEGTGSYGAALACVVVVNDYTRDQDFADSELVLDGFGGDGSVGVLRDPYQLAPATRFDVETLRRVAGRGGDRS